MGKYSGTLSRLLSFLSEGNGTEGAGRCSLPAPLAPAQEAALCPEHLAQPHFIWHSAAQLPAVPPTSLPAAPAAAKAGPGVHFLSAL